jgi:hypothetical protein
VPLTELLQGAAGSGRPSPARSAATEDRRHVAPIARPSTNAAVGHRDVFLGEVRRGKQFFYNTVVAQAQKIEFGPERVTFTFLPAHRTLREQLEQNRPWLESIAAAVSGKKMLVVSAQQDGPAEAPPPQAAAQAAKPVDLKAAAMTDAAVQAMLDVFPAEIEDVEEI